MADSPSYTDGVLPAGTPTILVERGVTDVSFICNSWDYQRDSREITRSDGYGQETAAKGIRVNPTGSATVQVATSATVRITPGETFTVTDPTSDTELNGLVFIVKSASSPRGKDEELTQSITFRKKIN